MITMRLMGTPEEEATLAAGMGALVEVFEASRDDPNRGHAHRVRQYLRVCVTDHTRERVATRVQRQEGTP